MYAYLELCYGFSSIYMMQISIKLKSFLRLLEFRIYQYVISPCGVLLFCRMNSRKVHYGLSFLNSFMVNCTIEFLQSLLMVPIPFMVKLVVLILLLYPQFK